MMGIEDQARARRGLAGVNDALFRELERLEAVDAADAEAMSLEIDRARAVRDVASTVLDNGRLVLEVARAGTDVGEAVHVPKGLLS